jgi:hypothetical protein
MAFFSTMPAAVVLNAFVRFLYRIGSQSLPAAFIRIERSRRAGDARQMLMKNSDTVFMLEVILQRHGPTSLQVTYQTPGGKKISVAVEPGRDPPAATNADERVHLVHLEDQPRPARPAKEAKPRVRRPPHHVRTGNACHLRC